MKARDKMKNKYLKEQSEKTLLQLLENEKKAFAWYKGDGNTGEGSNIMALITAENIAKIKTDNNI